MKKRIAPSAILTAGAGTQDPWGDGPSLSSKIKSGEVKLPAGAIYARDADFNSLYVNYEHIPRMIRVEAKAADKVHIQVYAETTREWIKLPVPLTYPLGTDLDRLPAGNKPREDEKRKEAGKRLAASRPVKEALTPEKHHGKKVFKGKIGETNALVDIGDGYLTLIIDKTGPKEMASKMKMELVSQSEASKYAMSIYTEAWKKGREGLKNAK